MKKPFRSPILFLLLLLTAARAQTVSPFVPERPAVNLAHGAGLVAENRANVALQAGFSATAAVGFRELLAVPELTPEARQRIELSLVSALMESGELAAAEKVLQDYTGPKSGAFHLRAGLLAAHARHWGAVRTELNACKIDELAPADRGWWYFLLATLADVETDAEHIQRRNRAYEDAVRLAVSELQKLRFILGQEQARVRGEVPNEAQLADYKKNMEKTQGRPGYDQARLYAAALSVMGRKDEALSVLQRQLLLLPATERSSADQFRLHIGLIAGAGSGEGRRALFEILTKSLQPEKQRQALLLLVQAAKTGPELDRLRNNLSELIDAPVPHPILEDLLLARAMAALQAGKFNEAGDDARALLDRFPGSPLKPAALGVQLSVAWELKRFRKAADVCAQLRAVLPDGQKRAELGILLAEASFNVGDFQNAADSYEAALHDAAVPGAPQVMPTGEIIFQRVLSNIRLERLEIAAKLIDEMAASPVFDAVNRWQAEWNLVKAFQVHGQTAQAQARVEKLLRQGAQDVPDELRIRLLWLRAKLAFDNGQAESAVAQADELVKELARAKIPEDLRADVASTAWLVKAQALQGLGRDEDAEKLLGKLRVDYRSTPAAVYSYIVQASRYSAKDNLVKAQELLIKLKDEHPTSEFAPLAIYEAAINAERRGGDERFNEAHTLLEGLVLKYPKDELVFYARLKQGDLSRKLNDFAIARQVYEELINKFGQHPDVLLAQIGLADSLSAQGGSLVNAESAAAIYERLRDLPSAAIDLRVEAGCKWGSLLAKPRRVERTSAEATAPDKAAQIEKAVTVYWSVINDFLLDGAQAAKLGAKGRWWMSRCLIELGQLNEDAGRLDEAQRLYQLIIDQNLGGTLLAKARLARYRNVEGLKP